MTVAFDNHTLQDDKFGLYDLRVTTVHLDTSRPMICDHPEGSCFEVQGENISIPKGGATPMHQLASLLPLLPSRQRMNHRSDWMETDAHEKCPDRCCCAAFLIERVGVAVLRNSQVSGAVGDLMTGPDFGG